MFFIITYENIKTSFILIRFLGVCWEGGGPSQTAAAELDIVIVNSVYLGNLQNVNCEINDKKC
jgi:hypothetical protein